MSNINDNQGRNRPRGNVPWADLAYLVAVAAGSVLAVFVRVYA